MCLIPRFDRTEEGTRPGWTPPCKQGVETGPGFNRRPVETGRELYPIWVRPSCQLHHEPRVDRRLAGRERGRPPRQQSGRAAKAGRVWCRKLTAIPLSDWGGRVSEIGISGSATAASSVSSAPFAERHAHLERSHLDLRHAIALSSTTRRPQAGARDGVRRAPKPRRHVRRQPR